MSFRLLLDENVERAVASRLDDAGYDVERVAFVSALGPTTDDDRIIAYARETNRVILTYDDDFVSKDSGVAVFYVPEASISGDDVAAIVREITAYYPQSELDGVVYLSRDWIE